MTNPRAPEACEPYVTSISPINLDAPTPKHTAQGTFTDLAEAIEFARTINGESGYPTDQRNDGSISQPCNSLPSYRVLALLGADLDIQKARVDKPKDDQDKTISPTKIAEQLRHKAEGIQWSHDVFLQNHDVPGVPGVLAEEILEAAITDASDAYVSLHLRELPSSYLQGYGRFLLLRNYVTSLRRLATELTPEEPAYEAW